MALAVLLFHHADGPLTKIDWCTLGSLQERIRIEELPRSRPLIGVLLETFVNDILQNLREGIALRKSRRRLQNNLLQQIKNSLRPSCLVVILAVDAEGEFANCQLH